MNPPRRSNSSRGFTLIELLIVIGIIMVLMALLLPVVSHVRTRAYQASTEAMMNRLMQACQLYYHDWNAYPGPIPNSQLSGGKSAGQYSVAITGVVPGTTNAITSSENLALGLLGMINITPTSGGNPTLTFATPAGVGTAPHDVLSLNPLHPQSYHYFDYNANEITSQSGYSKDLNYAGGANPPPTDSNVPEFVDTFSDQMPILYIRAFVGGTSSGSGAVSNSDGTPVVQYNYNELKDYLSYYRTVSGTGTPFLFGSSTSTIATMYGNYTANNWADDEATPYTDWWNATPASGSSYYFMNPNIGGSVRGKDGFMLISAGIDRTYGTTDDIIVTP